MKYCYLCNQQLQKGINQTRDHIPPNGIFPSSTPQITVPCCLKCNGDYKELDEIMRNKFALLSEFAPPEIHAKVSRAFTKSPGKVEKIGVYTSSDSNNNLIRKMKFSPNELNWFSRIVRGIYYSEFGEQFPSHLELTTTALTYAPPIPDIHKSFLQSDLRTACFFCERMPDYLAEIFGGKKGSAGWMSVVYQKLFFVTMIHEES